MFKKKSNLPPRPKYPSTDQIISDLSDITNEDPLFKTVDIISKTRPKSEITTDQDDVYQKIKKFFNMHEDLNKVMMNLKVLNGELKEKEIDIVRLSDDLKDQALKALV